MEAFTQHPDPCFGGAGVPPGSCRGPRPAGRVVSQRRMARFTRQQSRTVSVRISGSGTTRLGDRWYAPRSRGRAASAPSVSSTVRLHRVVPVAQSEPWGSGLTCHRTMLFPSRPDRMGPVAVPNRVVLDPVVRTSAPSEAFEISLGRSVLGRRTPQDSRSPVRVTERTLRTHNSESRCPKPEVRSPKVSSSGLPAFIYG